MTDVGPDFWVCGECRSVNKLRSKQCYNCRTPKDIAEVDPTQIEGTGHGRLREIKLPEFHSSRGEALLASALILGVAIMQVVSTVVDARILGRILSDPALLTDLDFMRSSDVLFSGVVGLATLGVGLFALTAWAFWLSRVVMAMPALGLGYPAANGLMAFVENFLPGLNLFRVPAIVRDVIRRLEPGSGRGEALIFAAWIGLLGGFFLPRIGGFLNAFGADTLEGVVRNELLVQGVSTGLVLVGAIFLVALIWWIEQRIARRRVAQLEGEPAPAVGEPALAASGPGGAVGSAAAAGATYRVPEEEVSEDRPLAASMAAAADESRAYPPASTSRTGLVRQPVHPGSPVAPAPVSAPPTQVAPPAEVGPAAQVAPAPQVAPPAEVTPTTPARPEPEVVPETSTAPEPAWPARADASSSGPATAPPPPTPAPAGPPGGVGEPPGAVPASASSDPVLNRPITSVTGAASIPTLSLETPRPGSAPTQAPEPGPPPPAATPPMEHPATGSAPTAPAPTPDQVPAGPRLHLRVESATSMIATIEGESEPITLEELRTAAAALARADGSAVIATVATTFEALSLAEEAFEILTDARVDTTVED
jgi:hypothetical protein